MLEFADRFRLGRSGLIPVQVQVLLPITPSGVLLAIVVILISTTSISL